MRRATVALLLLLAVGPPAVASGRTIDAAELRALSESGQALLLIDVRPEQQYEQGHLEGAMNLPAFALRHRRLPSDARIVVYDGGDGTGEAEEALAALQALGHDVRRLAGGLLRWEALGHPIVRPTGSQPMRLVRWITPQQLQRLIDEGTDDLTIVDLRSREAFDGGRIPRAQRSSPESVVRDLGTRAVSRIVVVYGEGGESDLDAAEALRRAGVRAVRVLYGGFPNWTARGQEVAR